MTQTEQKRAQRKTRIGIVVSDVQDKTIVVRVDRKTAHRRYKKVLTRTKKYHAHDETNNAKLGDAVRIMETRPLSKQKRWRLLEVVRRTK
jgi:small subunit ribosomal protein S17